MALQARRRMRNLLLFIPNLVLLCVRLLSDARVPKTEKALVAGAIVYALIPFDFVPDLIPFVGQIDDGYLIALTLLRLAQKTEPAVVREHWNGGGDVVELIGAMALFTAKFLPSRIRRVLTSRVEMNADGLERAIKRPLLVEQQEIEIEAPAEFANERIDSRRERPVN
jgi:uncharacterized membrane protein YkvA (DUF1232 family)